MDDIAPELWDKIMTDFRSAMMKSRTANAVQKKADAGAVSYADCNAYAEEVGNILSRVFNEDISSDVLPGGRMYYNIAERVVRPPMENNYELISDITLRAQEAINKRAGIGLAAQKADLNTDRIDGLINIITGADSYDDVKGTLGEPVVNFCRSVVDSTARKNADVQHKAGLSVKVVRSMRGETCAWCEALAGTYDYESVKGTGSDVWRRHQNCDCLIEVETAKGRERVYNYREDNTKEARERRKQAINSRLTNDRDPARIEARKAIKPDKNEQNDFVRQVVAHPEMLGDRTPEELKATLIKMGYKVTPLSDGSQEDIPFENGGGYKVNFGGNGLLMYHPDDGSHHDGAYYKISTGMGGKRRYDIGGNEKES